MTEDRFCESCDSKGVSHKKLCPKRQAPAGKSSITIASIKENNEVVDKLLTVVEALQTRVEELSARLDTPNVAPKVAVSVAGTTVATENTTGVTPWCVVPKGVKVETPPMIREIVDEFFSPRFGVEIEALRDNPNFYMTVIVPNEFSNLTESDRECGIIDRRTKMIPAAAAGEAAKEFCKKIMANIQRTCQNKTLLEEIHAV